MFKLDPALEEYATPQQWEKLVAWEKYGTSTKAAKASGSDASGIRRARREVLKKAARQGYAPEYDLTHPVPPGLTLKGTSVRYDGDGAIQQFWNKTKIEGMAPDEAYVMPDPKTLVKLSTMLDAEGRVIVQWVAEKPEDIARERAWREFAKELAADLPRLDPIPPPESTNDQLLAGYPVGDHHMGMMSWGVETGADYDMKIAESLLKGAIDYLSLATGGASQAIVAFLGDFLHYDNMEAVTPTSKNVLDSDTRYPKMVHAAIHCMRYTIDAALRQHGQVHVIVEIGNHDLSSSVFLMECLKIAYENEPRVTVDTSPRHYHYYRFGRVLLGTHHGHGTKMQNLPLTMAADRPEDWGATDYRYFWTGHTHTGKTQPATSAHDYSGCIVESFRVLPPADAWAAQKAYRPHREMKAIVYHTDFGEVARHTINPTMLEKGITL